MEIAIALEIRPDSVRVNISKLKDKGLLERIGPAKGGYWEVL
jgi:ATP-dependent DNA helicase RecG